MRGSFVALLLLAFACAQAPADVIGPVYPAPGGNTYSGSGGAALTGGFTGVYTDFDPTAYDDLWWGLNGLPSITMPAGGGQLTFDGASSDLSAGIAVFLGIAYLPAWNGFDYAVRPMDTRWTIQAKDLNGASLSFVTGATQGVASPILLPVLSSFQLVHTAEARDNLSSGQFQAVHTIVESFHTPPTSPLYNTSINGGFYYTEASVVPLPAAAQVGLVLLGALGIRRALKRRIA